jgi:hypothetical protein
MFYHNALLYYYFDISRIIESERSESGEGIIDNSLSNKQNDDDAIIIE